MHIYLCLICRSPDNSVYFLAHTCKSFHPSLVFRLHTLGGICYTKFITVLVLPVSLSWRTHTVTLVYFPSMEYIPLNHTLSTNSSPFTNFLEYPYKNLVFKVGALSQCLTRADTRDCNETRDDQCSFLMSNLLQYYFGIFLKIEAKFPCLEAS